MRAFFAARVEGYDEHMLETVAGCKTGYKRMAEALPDSAKTLLDLGCGTGLELDEIFKRFPDLFVTGVDLCPEMLERLKQKHGGKRLTLLCESYTGRDFGQNLFDACVSFETLHHLEKPVKLSLYKSIFAALKDGGVYLECDYAAPSQAIEDELFENARNMRRAQSIPDDVFIHIDTPCTVENQRALLLQAGFAKVDLLFKEVNTALLRAEK